MLDEKGYAILNTDEVRFYTLVKDSIKSHVLTYGIEHRADVMARNIELFIDHSEFDLQVHDELYHVSVPVLARFNISNILAVVTSLLALEMPIMQIIDTDSINYPLVQICVTGGVFFYLVLAKASCKSIPKAAATPVPYAGSAL